MIHLYTIYLVFKESFHKNSKLPEFWGAHGSPCEEDEVHEEVGKLSACSGSKNGSLEVFHKPNQLAFCKVEIIPKKRPTFQLSLFSPFSFPLFDKFFLCEEASQPLHVRTYFQRFVPAAERRGTKPIWNTWWMPWSWSPGRGASTRTGADSKSY